MYKNLNEGTYLQLPRNRGFVSKRSLNTYTISVFMQPRKANIRLQAKSILPPKSVEIATDPLIMSFFLSQQLGTFRPTGLKVHGIKKINRANGSIDGYPLMIGNVSSDGMVCFGANGNKLGDSIISVYNLFWNGIFTPDYIKGLFVVNHRDCIKKKHRGCNRFDSPHLHRHRTTGNARSKVCDCCEFIFKGGRSCRCECRCDCHKNICNCECYCDTTNNFADFIRKNIREPIYVSENLQTYITERGRIESASAGVFIFRGSQEDRSASKNLCFPARVEDEKVLLKSGDNWIAPDKMPSISKTP